MNLLDPRLIRDWHAHVYFDTDRRDAAWALRETIGTALAGHVVVGRFHEKPVGPHPMWSFQLAIGNPSFPYVLGWLALNHGAMDVFVHPETGDGLRDHRDRALWLGRSHTLNLALFQG